MVSLSLIVLCLFAITVSWLVTPFVMTWAKRIGAIDQPNERKIHIRPIPRMGGVAVFISFSFGLVAQFLWGHGIASSWLTQSEGIMFLVALAVMFLLGIWDDLRTLKPMEKFLVQLALSTLMYISGFHVSSLGNSFGIDWVQIGVIDYVVTVVWIVGVTNAVNLIDGLDGLASGIGIVAAISISAVSLINGDQVTAAVALILVGSLVGFLRYNFNPAKIFLGDSGSLFVGFALAILSVQSLQHSTSVFAVPVALLVLGVPVVDTLLAMVRRFLKSFLPKQQGVDSLAGIFKSIFSPDRSHIHHRLIARGISHMKAVLLLYVVSIGFGFAAVLIQMANNHDSSLILLVVGMSLVLGVGQLRYREMAILRNGIVLRFYSQLNNWKLLRRTLFQTLIDLVFVAASYLTAYFLSARIGSQPPADGHLWISLAMVSFVQITVVWISGIYTGTINQAGVGDALRNLKSVGMATVTSAIAFGIFFHNDFWGIVTLFVIDFYLVLTFVVTSRFSFTSLKYLFEKEHAGEKRVLIYGADSQGVTILQNILCFDSQGLTPVGFLDDDPSLEGKVMNGYPIFGGHWKLHRLLERVSINEILLASENIQPETLRRLKIIARSHGVVIRRFQIRLEDVSREVSRTPKEQGTAIVDRSA